jgi:hypothetical protein
MSFLKVSFFWTEAKPEATPPYEEFEDTEIFMMEYDTFANWMNKIEEFLQYKYGEGDVWISSVKVINSNVTHWKEIDHEHT